MAEFHVNEGARVVSYTRRDLREERGVTPSHGTIVQLSSEQSLVAFDDGEVERVANESLLPEGGCPLCEKANKPASSFCGGCGVNLGEQAMLRVDEMMGKCYGGPGPVKDLKAKAAAAKAAKDSKSSDKSAKEEELIGTTPSGKPILSFPSSMYSSNAAFAEATEHWGLADHKAAALEHYQPGAGRNVVAGAAHEARLVEMGGMMSAVPELAPRPGAGGIIKRF